MLNFCFSFAEKAVKTSRFGHKNYATPYRKLRHLEVKSRRVSFQNHPAWHCQVPYLRIPNLRLCFLEHGGKEALLGNQIDMVDNSFPLPSAVSAMLGCGKYAVFQVKRMDVNIG